MPKTPKDRVQTIAIRSPDVADIMHAVLDIVRLIDSSTELPPRYGGMMVGNETIGVFPRKRHVTVEFGNGIHLADPDEVLEGKAKTRRHIVLNSIEDISTKHVREYIHASLSSAAGTGNNV